MVCRIVPFTVTLSFDGPSLSFTYCKLFRTRFSVQLTMLQLTSSASRSLSAIAERVVTVRF